MVLTEKKSPCRLWPRPKQRLWKERKQCWEASTTNHKKICHPPPRPRPWGDWSSSNTLSRALPEKQGWPCAVIMLPRPLSSHEEPETKQELMCAQCGSNRLWGNPMTLLTERGRCVFVWLLILMLWMLPTKPESFQLRPSANSKYSFHHTIHFWLNIY